MNKFLIAGIISIGMLGCAHEHYNYFGKTTPVRSPDGNQWYSIDCIKSITYCYEQAGIDCPHGYSIKEKDGINGQESEGHLFSNGYGASAHSKSSMAFRATMIIQCAEPPTEQDEHDIPSTR